MKRLRNAIIDVILVCVSLVIGFYVMRGIDLMAGYFVPQGHWPGSQGILFTPNVEYDYEVWGAKISDRMNALGIRDRDDLTVEKKCKCRIAAIGDSTTYGWRVNLEDTWVKRLEKHLRDRGLDVEVLNIGKPATGINEYAAIADVVIPILKPDLVILGIFDGNDPSDAWPDVLHPFTNILKIVKYWREYDAARQSPPPRTVNSVEGWRQSSVTAAHEILNGMSSADRARFEKLDPELKAFFGEGELNPWLIANAAKEPDRYVHDIDMGGLRLNIYCMKLKFQQVKRTAQKYGAQVVVLAIPEGIYVNNQAYADLHRIGYSVVEEMKTTDVPDRCIEIACKKASVPFHSFMKEFRERADESDLYLKLDNHMAPAGHELFAKAIAPIVAQYVDSAVK